MTKKTIEAKKSSTVDGLWDVYIRGKYYWSGTKRQVAVISKKYGYTPVFTEGTARYE